MRKFANTLNEIIHQGGDIEYAQSFIVKQQIICILVTIIYICCIFATL